MAVHSLWISIAVVRSVRIYVLLCVVFNSRVEHERIADLGPWRVQTTDMGPRQKMHVQDMHSRSKNTSLYYRHVNFFSFFYGHHKVRLLLT